MPALRVEIHAIGAPLARPVESARGAFAYRRGLLLRLSDDAGRVGQGEASPLPGYSRDDVDACRAALVRWGESKPAGLEVDAQRAGSTARIVDSLRTRMDEIEHAQPLPPAARFAVETALLDLAGQATGKPIAVLLGEATGQAPRTAVPLNALVDDLDVDRAFERARDAVARGFRTLKLKVGRPGAFDAELRVARALRRVLGPDVALRFDANGAFPFADVAARLAALGELDPELIEEPCAGRLPEVARLLQLQQGPRPPLAADESLQEEGALDALAPAIAEGLVRAIVLKPTALGGLIRCLDLATRARSLGAAALVTHCFDGPIALAAAAALAMALPSDGPQLACGLDRHAGLDAWPRVSLPMIDGAWARLGAASGLGLPSLASSVGVRA